MVLDKGEIIEFDNPDTLLKDKTSKFYNMAKDAGLVNDDSNGGSGTSGKTHQPEVEPSSPYSGTKIEESESRDHSEVYFLSPSQRSPARHNIDSKETDIF